MIHFTPKSREMKIGKDKGKTKYYAQPDKPRIITFEEVVTDIAEMSSLTTGDVRNAIDRLAYYLQRELSEGNTVQLGQIGTFRMRTSSRFVDSLEEVDASILKEPKVEFVVNSHLRAAKNNLRVQVHNPHAKGATSTTSTNEGKQLSTFPDSTEVDSI